MKTFRPMLSATLPSIDQLDHRKTWLCSPKLDGIRAMVIDGVLVSRNLKPIPNKFTQKTFGHAELNYLDGELIVGEPTGHDVWNRTQSGVMSSAGEPDVRFYVFDDFTNAGDGFEYRLECAASACDFDWIHLVKHTRLRVDQISSYEERMLAEGYEGVMIRDPQGAYKFGRSTLKEQGLMKLIRRRTSEARVTGFVEQMHNGNDLEADNLGLAKRSKKKSGLTGKGTLGALVCTTGAGVEFEIGTGFDEATRARIWSDRKKHRGLIVKYEYRELTKDKKPRFPVFIGFRDPRDMD